MWVFIFFYFIFLFNVKCLNTCGKIYVAPKEHFSKSRFVVFLNAFVIFCLNMSVIFSLHHVPYFLNEVMCKPKDIK